MTNQNKATRKQPGSGISITGNGNVIGDNNRVSITTTIGADLEQVSKAFSKIYGVISKITDPALKEDTHQAVSKIEEEVKKGDSADPMRLERWLTNLASMAPDIWDVAVSTLGSPLAGLSTVVRKVIAKARAQKPSL
jgi:hypothetical protein